MLAGFSPEHDPLRRKMDAYFRAWRWFGGAILCLLLAITLLGAAMTNVPHRHSSGTATLQTDPREFNGFGNPATAALDTGETLVLDVDSHNFKGQKIPYWKDLQTGSYSTDPNYKAGHDWKMDKPWIGLLALMAFLLMYPCLFRSFYWAGQDRHPSTKKPSSIPNQIGI